jgi:hypothetical protein
MAENDHSDIIIMMADVEHDLKRLAASEELSGKLVSKASKAISNVEECLKFTAADRAQRKRVTVCAREDSRVLASCGAVSGPRAPAWCRKLRELTLWASVLFCVIATSSADRRHHRLPGKIVTNVGINPDVRIVWYMYSLFSFPVNMLILP